jgi:hypothetical protein
MNNVQKQIELTALRESFESKAISSDQYVEGITHIMHLPDDAPFSSTKNLGLKMFENAVKVGKCMIPFSKESKLRKLRVATFLKDSPEEEKGQRKHYAN